jgi:tripartite-type tricarboxylate transporter receptor subunit TctC
VRSGKARLLATSGAQRAAAFPNVPTFKEEGYDIEGTGWYALFAPARTPQSIVGRLSRASVEAMREHANRLEQLGLEPTGLGPRELARIMRADYERWGPVIRASGFKPDN